MTAAAVLLSDLSAAGCTLALEPPDTLLLRGPGDSRARFAPLVRSLKGELLALMTANDAPTPSPSAEVSHRLWDIRLPDGQRFSSSFTPPATRAEIRGWYPDAISIEPEEANP